MTIKIVLLCSILGMLSERTFAQNSDNIDYVKQVEKYRRMKIAGATLTVVGSVFVVASVVIMINSAETLYEDDSKAKNATICAVVGYASLGAGIPLWIVGGVQHKKYSAKLKQVSVKINATPRSQGLTLTYRF